MNIRPSSESDWTAWLQMRYALWPQDALNEHESEMRGWLERADTAVFIATRPDGSVCGFCEVGSRPYADGCRSSPVGYVEGWYVEPDARQQGYGRGLLNAAEAWARERGYEEMASDALLDNAVSHAAHAGCWYEEVGRVVQFRKPLSSDK